MLFPQVIQSPVSLKPFCQKPTLFFVTWLQTSFGRVAQRVTYVLHGEDTVQLFYCCVKQLSQMQSYSGNPYTQCHWRSLHLKMRKRFKRMGSIPEENLRIPTRSSLQVAHCCLRSHKNSIKVLCSSSADFYARSTLNTSDHSPVHRDPAHDNRVKDDQSHKGMNSMHIFLLTNSKS